MKAFIEYRRPSLTRPDSTVPALGSFGTITVDGRHSLQNHIKTGYALMAHAPAGVCGFRIYEVRGSRPFEGVEVYRTP